MIPTTMNPTEAKFLKKQTIHLHVGNTEQDKETYNMMLLANFHCKPNAIGGKQILIRTVY